MHLAPWLIGTHRLGAVIFGLYRDRSQYQGPQLIHEFLSRTLDHDFVRWTNREKKKVEGALVKKTRLMPRARRLIWQYFKEKSGRGYAVGKPFVVSGPTWLPTIDADGAELMTTGRDSRSRPQWLILDKSSEPTFRISHHSPLRHVFQGARHYALQIAHLSAWPDTEPALRACYSHIVIESTCLPFQARTTQRLWSQLPILNQLWNTQQQMNAFFADLHSQFPAHPFLVILDTQRAKLWIYLSEQINRLRHPELYQTSTGTST